MVTTSTHDYFHISLLIIFFPTPLVTDMEHSLVEKNKNTKAHTTEVFWS
jgi:hypothetical protein